MERSTKHERRITDAGRSRLRRVYEPVLRRAIHLYWRFHRGMTLGVRALVIDGQGRVFLVKHSYTPGWHLPGGGVEVGETMLTSLVRELKEEGNIDIAGNPTLHGIYFNARVSRRDHVALFVVRDFVQDRPPRPNREIVATGFFALNALPADTTPATRARIAEFFDSAPAPEQW